MKKDSIILFLASAILSYLLTNILFSLDVNKYFVWTILTCWFIGIFLINIGVYISNRDVKGRVGE